MLVEKSRVLQENKKSSRDKTVISRNSWQWSVVKKSKLFKKFLVHEYNGHFKKYLCRIFKKGNVIGRDLEKNTKKGESPVRKYI